MGEFEFSDSPNVKYDFVNDFFTDSSDVLMRDSSFLKGLRPLRLLTTQTSSETGLIKIYTDPDACGVMFYYAAHNAGPMISAQVDGGQNIYALQTDRSSDDSRVLAGFDSSTRILSCYLSFPRGSHTITLRQESSDDFKIAGTGEIPIFVGFRQLRTRPKLESLTLTQSAVKFYDVAPHRLFKATYEADYTAAGSLDNVDSVTETGTWSATAATATFNGTVSRSSTANDTVDIQFTLVGNGGGISMMTEPDATGSAEIDAFLNAAAAASEVSTKLISKISTEFIDGVDDDVERITLLGLPSGTYTLRVKIIDGNTFDYASFSIWDTVDPDEDSINVGELTNTGQGIGHAWPHRNLGIQKDNTDRIPARLIRSGYKKDEAIGYYRLESGFTTPGIDDANSVGNQQRWFSGSTSTSDIDAEVGTMFFAKSVHILH